MFCPTGCYHIYSMGKIKRIFLIVLDSFGMGELPDAQSYGDAGSDTLAAVAASRFFHAPRLAELATYSIN